MKAKSFKKGRNPIMASPKRDGKAWSISISNRDRILDRRRLAVPLIWPSARSFRDFRSCYELKVTATSNHFQIAWDYEVALNQARSFICYSSSRSNVEQPIRGKDSVPKPARLADEFRYKLHQHFYHHSIQCKTSRKIDHLCVVFPVPFPSTQ